MLLLGCRPPGRNTEQHDIFFSIGPSLGSLKEDILRFWPEAKGKVHIDAWREVSQVDGFAVKVVKRDGSMDKDQTHRLFFLNLGGYKPGEFEEYHYKMLSAGTGKADAIKAARQTAFYKHTGFKGAEAHIDDKYGVDVDEVHEIEDILPERVKEMYMIRLERNEGLREDEMQLGYLKLEKI